MLQTAYHLAVVAGSHHLSLRNAGIEFQLVRRVLCCHMTVCLICLLIAVEGCQYLSHEEPLAGFLRLAALALDSLAQIG